eukprot:GHVT01101640.1.p1 GENE.GHVT01101640.1~~GHVT01101640.1.p1  ORF type:complete len:1342 (+),score=166.76 GHVT01101640.1:837-4862(+)
MSEEHLVRRRSAAIAFDLALSKICEVALPRLWPPTAVGDGAGLEETSPRELPNCVSAEPVSHGPEDAPGPLMTQRQMTCVSYLVRNQATYEPSRFAQFNKAGLAKREQVLGGRKPAVVPSQGRPGEIDPSERDPNDDADQHTAALAPAKVTLQPLEEDQTPDADVVGKLAQREDQCQSDPAAEASRAVESIVEEPLAFSSDGAAVANTDLKDGARPTRRVGGRRSLEGDLGQAFSLEAAEFARHLEAADRAAEIATRPVYTHAKSPRLGASGRRSRKDDTAESNSDRARKGSAIETPTASDTQLGGVDPGDNRPQVTPNNRAQLPAMSRAPSWVGIRDRARASSSTVSRMKGDARRSGGDAREQRACRGERPCRGTQRHQAAASRFGRGKPAATQGTAANTPVTPYEGTVGCSVADGDERADQSEVEDDAGASTSLGSLSRQVLGPSAAAQSVEMGLMYRRSVKVLQQLQRYACGFFRSLNLSSMAITHLDSRMKLLTSLNFLNISRNFLTDINILPPTLAVLLAYSNRIRNVSPLVTVQLQGQTDQAPKADAMASISVTTSNSSFSTQKLTVENAAEKENLANTTTEQLTQDTTHRKTGRVEEKDKGNDLPAPDGSETEAGIVLATSPCTIGRTTKIANCVDAGLRFSALVYLGIGFNMIDEGGLCGLVASCPNLHYLDVSWNALVNLYETLKTLQSLLRLRDLTLLGNPNSIDPTYFSQTVKALPSLEKLDGVHLVLQPKRATPLPGNEEPNQETEAPDQQQAGIDAKHEPDKRGREYTETAESDEATGNVAQSADEPPGVLRVRLQLSQLLGLGSLVTAYVKSRHELYKLCKHEHDGMGLESLPNDSEQAPPKASTDLFTDPPIHLSDAERWLLDDPLCLLKDKVEGVAACEHGLDFSQEGCSRHAPEAAEDPLDSPASRAVEISSASKPAGGDGGGAVDSVSRESKTNLSQSPRDEEAVKTLWPELFDEWREVAALKILVRSPRAELLTFQAVDGDESGVVPESEPTRGQLRRSTATGNGGRVASDSFDSIGGPATMESLQAKKRGSTFGQALKQTPKATEQLQMPEARIQENFPLEVKKLLPTSMWEAMKHDVSVAAVSEASAPESSHLPPQTIEISSSSFVEHPSLESGSVPVMSSVRSGSIAAVGLDCPVILTKLIETDCPLPPRHEVSRCGVVSELALLGTWLTQGCELLVVVEPSLNAFLPPIGCLGTARVGGPLGSEAGTDRLPTLKQYANLKALSPWTSKASSDDGCILAVAPVDLADLLVFRLAHEVYQNNEDSYLSGDAEGGVETQKSIDGLLDQTNQERSTCARSKFEVLLSATSRCTGQKHRQTFR